TRSGKLRMSSSQDPEDSRALCTGTVPADRSLDTGVAGSHPDRRACPEDLPTRHATSTGRGAGTGAGAGSPGCPAATRGLSRVWRPSPATPVAEPAAGECVRRDPLPAPVLLVRGVSTGLGPGRRGARLGPPPDPEC